MPLYQTCTPVLRDPAQAAGQTEQASQQTAEVAGELRTLVDTLRGGGA